MILRTNGERKGGIRKHINEVLILFRLDKRRISKSHLSTTRKHRTCGFNHIHTKFIAEIIVVGSINGKGNNIRAIGMEIIDGRKDQTRV